MGHGLRHALNCVSTSNWRPMKSLSIEVRVGFFILVAAVLFVGFMVALGDIRLAPGAKVYADFGFAGGLQQGTAVKLSGIRLGHVTELHILSRDSTPAAAASVAELGRGAKAQVRAVLALDDIAKPMLRQDVTFAVATSGLIGETYLELRPGNPDATPLPDGQPLRGVDAPQLHILELQVSALLDAVSGLLVGPDADNGTIGAAVGQLLNTVNGVLVDRRSDLVAMVTNAAAASGDLRSVLASVRHTVGDGEDLRVMVSDGRTTLGLLKDDLPELIESSQAALTSLQALSDKANKSLDAKALSSLLQDASSAAHRLEKISTDAQSIMTTIRRGEGTVGGLVQDPQLYDDIKEMLRDLKTHPWKFLWRD